MHEKVRELATLNVEKVVQQERKGKVEENVRSIIVTELLQCLGWYKLQGDLDFEHNVENKRADIALMVENSPKVIVECKDLNIDLDKFIDQAFDYAETKQIQWIILTNGLETRLYSTFMENVPNRKDRILIDPPIKLNELEARFNELEQWISKESILNRQLEFFTEIRKRQILKGVNTNNLKRLFLESTPILKDYYQKKILISLREEKKKKKDSTEREILDWLHYKGINFKDQALWSKIYGKEAAFNLINRIFFLRICEDRKFSDIPIRLSKEGIEAWSISHKDWTYKNLLQDTFEEIKKIDYEAIYKRNVFDIVDIKEKLLEDLLQRFSKIDFRNIDGDILKNIYEKHISKEERKELGQYYTPSYIIRFILHSIDNLSELELTLPSQEFMVLDPACGSGGFLIEAYDILKTKMLKSNWDQEIIHETILNKHLYGLEVEPFAAQFASINLLIKDITHPVNYVLIAQEDTLIAGGTKQKRLQPFKIKKIISKTSETDFIEKEFPLENYDAVVGNPPYFLISSQEGSRPSGREFHTTYFPKQLMNKYRTLYYSWPHNNKNPNIFYLFVERGVELLKNNGRLGYIIPDIILAGDSTRNLRKYILNNCKINKIIMIDGKVFKEGGITNIIIILQKCDDKKIQNSNEIEIMRTSIYELKENDINHNYHQFIEAPHKIRQTIFSTNPFNVFSVRMTQETVPIFDHIHNRIKLGKLVTLGKIAHIQRGIENLKKEDTLDKIQTTKKTIRKLIAVDNIDKFQINWESPSFFHRFVDYNNSKKTKIDFKQEFWFTQPKIVLKRVSNKLICALDPQRKKKTDYFYTLDSVQMIWLKIPHDEKYRLRTLVAILNSDFMNLYYTTLFSYKKLFSRVQKIFLKTLPVPAEIDGTIQNQICDLVKKLEDEYEVETERELNKLVNSIFFTEEELEEFQPFLSQKYTLKDLPGLGAEAAFRLSKHRILTIDDLIRCNAEEIAKTVKGVGIKSLSKWQKVAKDLTSK